MPPKAGRLGAILAQIMLKVFEIRHLLRNVKL